MIDEALRQARIRELRNAIEGRELEIRRTLENIDILDIEEKRISGTLASFEEFIPNNKCIIALNNVSVSEFQGVTRTKTEEILSEMSAEIVRRIGNHRENAETIDLKITDLHGRVSTLRDENLADRAEIASLNSANPDSVLSNY